MQWETNTGRDHRSAGRDGWENVGGTKHTKFRKSGWPMIMVPRHRVVTQGVAAAIAKAAGWTKD